MVKTSTFPESAQRRKSKSRIAEATRRREELADLKYRNAAAAAAGIDFAGTGRATRKLLTATGISKAVAGRPHEVVFEDANGEIRSDRTRLAGNVLIWRHKGLLLRLEGARSKAEALRIARSVGGAP